MKIAVLSSHTPSLFWFRMDMMKSFVEMGYEVIAVANEPEEKWVSIFSDEKISYRQINVNRNGTNPLNDLRTLFSISKVLREERPDKIFSYQAKTVIYGGIAAKFLKINEVYSLIAGLGSVYLSDKFKDAVLSKLLTAEYKVSLKNSKKVFFQNADDSGEFLKRKVLPQEKIVYLSGSGVNTDVFQPTPLPTEPCFLSIGRLIGDKGIREYLEACRIAKKENSGIRCMLVGPYDTNPTALTPAELEPFITAGVVEYFGEQSDIKPYVSECSIFVLPSYREGTPKTVLEAMAMGRAVITTDAPGCRETVRDGENGYLVPVKDSNALAKKMLELSKNHLLVAQMGQVGRKMAESIFDVRIINSCIAKTMGLYQIGEKDYEPSTLQ